MTWYYFEPSCFSTSSHGAQRPLSIWKILNYSQHSIELFPKGSVANDSVAARRWWILDTQLLRIPQCLQRSLAVRMHASLEYVRRKKKSAITELSLRNHLNAISAWKLVSEAVHLVWAVRNGDVIVEMGILKRSSFLLCTSLYVVAAVHNTNRDTVSPHRLVFHWCWFRICFADMTNAVLGLSFTVYKMLSYSVISYLHSNWDFLLGL